MSEGEGQKETRAEVALSGLPGSPGVALGKAVVLAIGRTGVVHRHVESTDVAEEIERFKSGVAKAAAELHRYPDGAAEKLRLAIGRHHGLDAARIICGAGSDELLNLLVRAYCGPGDVGAAMPAASYAFKRL